MKKTVNIIKANVQSVAHQLSHRRTAILATGSSGRGVHGDGILVPSPPFPANFTSIPTRPRTDSDPSPPIPTKSKIHPHPSPQNFCHKSEGGNNKSHDSGKSFWPLFILLKLLIILDWTMKNRSDKFSVKQKYPQCSFSYHTLAR